jgi:antirestriction protein ArdC
MKHNRESNMSHKDTYAEVTADVLEALEGGTIPWRQPWRSSGPQRNLQSNRPYRGVNQLLTQIKAQSKGYSSPFWTTYRAAKKAGGQVRKGEKGTRVVFWKFLKVADEDDPTKTKTIPMLRGYTVFNVEQCDGLEVPEIEQDAPVDALANCDAIIDSVPEAPTIETFGDSAFYEPARDRVVLPERDRFDDSEAYYATAFHELAHATGHESRLAREGVMDVTRFGSESYSREELIAELTSAFVSTEAGIGTDTLPRSAAYIDHWRKALEDDPRAVVVAAGKAQKAADWILDRRQAPEGEGEQA